MIMLYAIIVCSLLGYIHCVENIPSDQDVQEIIVHFRNLQQVVGELNKRLESAEKENLATRYALEMVKMDNGELRKKISTLESEIILLQNNGETRRHRDETGNGNARLNTPGELSGPVGLNKRLLLPGVSDTIQKIAFSAVLSHDVSLGRLQTINYDKIITNMGNAYDLSDGHFIAPVKGLYLLTATALNYEGHTLHLEMVRNGMQLATIYVDPDDYSMGSQTVIVVLEQSDKIWVRRYMDEGVALLYGRSEELYNTFSGVLIYDM